MTLSWRAIMLTSRDVCCAGVPADTSKKSRSFMNPKPPAASTYRSGDSPRDDDGDAPGDDEQTQQAATDRCVFNRCDS